MPHVGDIALWRANFVDGLRLLGKAAAHLPLGVPDPIICGATAVELYTGGLWPPLISNYSSRTRGQWLSWLVPLSPK